MTVSLPIGAVFGKWRVVSRERGGWRCVCACGTERKIKSNHLTSGHTKSCGCARHASLTKHGHAKVGRRTRTYSVWIAMRARCQNPNSQRWHRYGGRNITICERWLSYEIFLADMGEAPRGLQLERRNNDGPYTKDNCYWADRFEQGSNTSKNHNITVQGRTQPLIKWAREAGISPSTIHARLRGGWPVHDAVLRPPDRRFANKVKKAANPLVS